MGFTMHYALAAGNVDKLVLRDGTEVRADEYVSAMPVDVLKRMVPEEWSTMPYFKQLDELEGIPVINLQLWFDRKFETSLDGLAFSRTECDRIKERAASRITDQMMKAAKYKFPHNPPATKEAYYIRETFEKFYPSRSAATSVPGGPSVACSTAKAIEWDEAWSDPTKQDQSGRFVDTHDAAVA